MPLITVTTKGKKKVLLARFKEMSLKKRKGGRSSFILSKKKKRKKENFTRARCWIHEGEKRG